MPSGDTNGELTNLVKPLLLWSVDVSTNVSCSEYKSDMVRAAAFKSLLVIAKSFYFIRAIVWLLICAPWRFIISNV